MFTLYANSAPFDLEFERRCFKRASVGHIEVNGIELIILATSFVIIIFLYMSFANISFTSI